MQGIFFKVSSTKCQRRLDKIGTKTKKVNANGVPVDGTGQRAKEKERIRVDHLLIVGGPMAAITNGQVMVMPRNREDGQTVRTAGFPQPPKMSTPKKAKKKKEASMIIPRKEKMKLLALDEVKPIQLPIGVQNGKDKAKKIVETGSTARGFKSE